MWQALAARMCSAAAARVVSGRGSEEKAQGSAVQMPCPSKAWERSTRTTLCTPCARASATAPETAPFNADSTVSAAADVDEAFALSPVHTKFVRDPESEVPSAIWAGWGIGW